MNVTVGGFRASKLQNDKIGTGRGRAVKVSSRLEDDVVILSLNGKFVAGADGLVLRQQVKELIETGRRKLLFNFAEVPYIDSTGLGFLAGSRELAAEAGAIIVLAGMNPHVRRILDGVKLTQFFHMAEDEKAGLARIEQLGTSGQAGTPAGRANNRQPPNIQVLNGQAQKTPPPDAGLAKRAAEE
jgi:anti-sigma B factor antagonist